MSQGSSSSGSDIAEQVVMIASSANNIEQMEIGDHWQQLVCLVSQYIVNSRLNHISYTEIVRMVYFLFFISLLWNLSMFLV